MGKSDDEDYLPSTKKPSNNPQPSQTKSKLKMLLLVILTNLLTIYIFTGPANPISQNLPLPPYYDQSRTLLQELNTTKHHLKNSRSQLGDLQQQLRASSLLSKSLLKQLSAVRELFKETAVSSVTDSSTYNDFVERFSSLEAKIGMGPHKLPLGFYSRVGSDQLYPSVGGACLKYKEELDQYMSYNVGEDCPVDDVFAQKLMMKGCEPLPRRRCHPKAPRNYPDPAPLPESLWTGPPDSSIIWDPYSCKNYSCLNNRRNMPGYYDCNDCFDLKGREKSRWIADNGGLDFGIDKILRSRPPGTIRIGLDIGGGSGTFAARMKERNVTIVTTSMNLDGPFNSFIASRGLLSMHVTVSQRLPFFENTLDIVHSMHVLSNWIPDAMLEFTFYDIYRVLRPGGIFWLDHFFCFGSQLNATYVPMLGRVGFKKLRWTTGMKLDRGVDKNEWYFSALLEKPKL